MNWKKWLKPKPPKRPVSSGSRAAKSAAPEDTYAPLRELLYADEPLENVARFVLEEEAFGGHVGLLWRRLANVAAWAAQGHHPRAIQELRSLLEDEGDNARSFFQFWNFLRQLGEVPGSGLATRVLGLVIEHARQGAPEILAAYWDGSTRLMDVKGDFRVFEQPSPVMVASVRQVLLACEPLVAATPPDTGPRPAPPIGARCRITVLTPAGLRAREADWAALWDDELCGPVLDMAGALSEQMRTDGMEKGLWGPGVPPWPRRGGPHGGGGPLVH